MNLGNRLLSGLAFKVHVVPPSFPRYPLTMLNDADAIQLTTVFFARKFTDLVFKIDSALFFMETNKNQGKRISTRCPRLNQGLFS